MKKEWFQVITNITVLIGLGLVVYEVNQGNVHKNAELGTVSFEMSMNRLSAAMGDNSSTVIAKAMSDPDNLSLEELVVVNAHHNHVYLEILHYSWMAQVGIYTGDSWHTDVRNIAQKYLAYPFGRRWWSQQRNNINDDVLVTLVDAALAEEPDFRLGFFDSIGNDSIRN